MKRYGKFLVWGFGILLTIYFAPIAFTGVEPVGSSRLYFYRGRCVCGNPIYCRVDGENYFEYSPGHRHPEACAFGLKAHDGQWDMIRLAPPEGTWAIIPEGSIVGHLKIDHGSLYETKGTNWVKLSRVYDPWPIWYGKYFGR